MHKSNYKIASRMCLFCRMSDDPSLKYSLCALKLWKQLLAMEERYLCSGGFADEDLFYSAVITHKSSSGVNRQVPTKTLWERNRGDFTMAKEDVLKSVEEVIKAAKKDLKKNTPTSDQVRQFTGLINCYTRLLTQSELLDATDDGKGDPNYYEKMILE